MSSPTAVVKLQEAGLPQDDTHVRAFELGYNYRKSNPLYPETTPALLHQHYPDLDRDIFQWKNGAGHLHPLWDIDDSYLSNIIKRLQKSPQDDYHQAILDFLLEERRIRANDIF